MASDKTERKLTLEFARYELFTIFLPGFLHCSSTVLTSVLYNGLLPGFFDGVVWRGGTTFPGHTCPRTARAHYSWPYR